MKVAVVIAAYNEEEIIAPLTRALIEALDKLAATTWELIYVIDGTDTTLAQAKQFAAERAEIKILYNEQPSGLGAAFRRGFNAVPVDTDFVVTMDADFNHQPRDIAALITSIQDTGADIIVGSRRLKASAVEGTPAWKNALSQTVNAVMRRVMAVPVSDMTSGFRVYRAEALRRIEFSNVGFAFLPEILIAAVALGMTIVERPIHFIFREAGQSKMRFAATSFSYVKLFLRYSVPISVWLAVGLLLMGILVRVGLSYPAHKYPGDSDAILSGLCGLEVLDGKLRLFFPGGLRLSSQSCYVTAGMFSLFGVTRDALAGTSIVYGTLFLVFVWLALKQATGRAGAVVGVSIAAFAPKQFLAVTYPPWAYSEIMAFSACTLWLGFRLMDKGRVHTWVEYLAFGMSVGFSFWTSPQTLMVSGPVIIMLLLLRSLPLRRIPITLAGVAICLYPYILIILYRGVSPLNNFANRPVSSIEQLQANATYLFSYVIPALLFTRDLEDLSVASLNGARALIIGVALTVTTIVVFARTKDRTVEDVNMRRALVVALLIVLCSCGLYSVSGAGGIRGGGTIRYIAPIFLAVPLLFAVAFAVAKTRWARVSVGALAASLVIAHTAEYPFFNAAERLKRTQEWTTGKRTISWISRNHREMVVGDYWTVYSLNFDTERAIRGIPIYGVEDYLGFGFRLQAPVRAALLDRDKSHLTAWIERIGLEGRVEEIDQNLFGYVIDKPINIAELDQIQSAGQQLPRVF